MPAHSHANGSISLQNAPTLTAASALDSSADSAWDGMLRFALFCKTRHSKWSAARALAGKGNAASGYIDVARDFRPHHRSAMVQMDSPSHSASDTLVQKSFHPLPPSPFSLRRLLIAPLCSVCRPPMPARGDCCAGGGKGQSPAVRYAANGRLSSERGRRWWGATGRPR